MHVFYKTFDINAYYAKTKRKRTFNLIARNEEEVIELLINLGYKEPYLINEIFREPTESQIKYATYLGIKIPKWASLEDVSALIDREVNEDSDPDNGLIDFALDKGIHIFSKYIGKKALYQTIFYNLVLEDKIAFFIFCIYRWLSDDNEINLNKSKYKDLFYEFSKKMMDDGSFIKSLSRYEGENLIFFGTLRYQWNDYYGGSKDTIAYKTCVLFLKEKLGLLPERKNVVNPNIRKIKKNFTSYIQENKYDYDHDGFPPIKDTNRNKNRNQKNQGCLVSSVAFLFLFLIFLIIV